MNKNLLKIGGGILALLGIVALLSFLLSKAQPFRGISYEEPYPLAPQIALKKADGEMFRLSEQQGKIVLIFFGYTSCPDVCPTTLAEMKMLMDELGDLGKNVQVVFVSVDPDRDTSEKVQTYVNHFHPSFLGLTGSMGELSPIWRDYSIVREEVQSDSSFGVIINHTALLFLVDQQGNLRLSFPYQTPVKDIAHDIKLLLEQ